MGEAGMSDNKMPWAGAEADLSGASLKGVDLGAPADLLAHPDVRALVEAAEDAEYDLLQWIECSEWLTKAGFNMDGTPEVAAKLRATLAKLKGGDG